MDWSNVLVTVVRYAHYIHSHPIMATDFATLPYRISIQIHASTLITAIWLPSVNHNSDRNIPNCQSPHDDYIGDAFLSTHWLLTPVDTSTTYLLSVVYHLVVFVFGCKQGVYQFYTRLLIRSIHLFVYIVIKRYRISWEILIPITIRVSFKNVPSSLEVSKGNVSVGHTFGWRPWLDSDSRSDCDQCHQ